MNRILARSGFLAALTVALNLVATHASARTVWVYFEDKGLASDEEREAAIRDAQAQLPERTKARRSKVGLGGADRGERTAPIVDLLDVPVSERYIDAVRATGATIRHASRWLNAVSCRASDAEISLLLALPFVTAVRDVGTTRRVEPDVAEVELGEGAPAADGRALNYGHCSSQILPIQVNQLHNAGLSGAGVLVALFDTGFLRTHQALDQVAVAGEYDFVQNDPITSNQMGDDPNQHNHGTMCLSLIAGYDPGNLIGPAYGAEYLLAKTETISSETPAEEDNWVAAAEWAEGLGADVISTSLGYKDWYTYADMDGETAPITIAADLAVSQGVCVFASAGNEGDSDWFYIAAPADGDLVMSIGAVDSTGSIAPFSSHGPTFDGRIKPDVCAMGRGDLIALPWDNTGYGRGSGTSFSCPITAGVAALLIQSHPTWGPLQVRAALRSTASMAASPDNSYGWGIIRGWNANGTPTGVPEIAAGGTQWGPASAVFVSPNPTSEISSVRAALRPGERVLGIEILDVRGRLIRTIAAEPAASDRVAASWDGRDETGRLAPSGLYFANVKTSMGSRSARILRLR